MVKIKAAAVYARISSDQAGTALGVKRQVADCRKLAAERGWMVAEEYVDNDVSAYSGKPRPAYARMIDDLTAGCRDAVIVYNLDRLHRRPVELEQFVDLCEAVGVRDVATVTADIDLGNDDGLFMARIFAAFAAKESGRRSARVKRKIAANAEAGLPNGGALRPFGYRPDRLTIVEDEAVVIRTLVARFCAGESVRSLTAWLTTSQVPSVTGRPWRTTTVRGLLVSARNAGLREHNGQVVGPATWPAIISGEQRDRVLSRMAARARSGRRAPRTYLLSGMLRCGRCNNVLFSQARHPNHPGSRTPTRRYVCLSGPDHGGCGRLTVVAEPVEALITQAVLTRLDSPELADALAGKVNQNAELDAVAEQLAADQARLEELAGLYADGQVTAREWMTARDPIQARIRDAERRLAQAADTGPLHSVVGNAGRLRGGWHTIGLDRRQAIVKTVLDHAVIAPGTPGARSLDINRVQPQWRL